MFHDSVILQKAPQSPLIYGKGTPNENTNIKVYGPGGDVVGEGGTQAESDGTWKVYIGYSICICLTINPQI